MENMMKRYADLSASFRNTKQSKESIEKLYEFLGEINGAADKTAQLVTSQVYSLLGYHKKAYDIFVSIADKSNRKDASRLFEMQQMATSHSDNFALKRKPAPVQQRPELTINDFVEETNHSPGEQVFAISGDNIIFGKPFKKNPLFVHIEGSLTLEAAFIEIAAYINWLETCKAQLIDFYNENFDDKAGDEWYDYLEIFGVRITLSEDRSLSAYITCGDDIASDHLLDVELVGTTVVSMSYDG